MPDLPRPARLSLHDAVGYVAELCECDLIKAGKSVLAALGEGVLVARADVLNRDRSQPVPLRRYENAGTYPVPTGVWASYQWSHFKTRAVCPGGNPKFRGRRADGAETGPIYEGPTIASGDIDAWLLGGRSEQGSTEETVGVATEAVGEKATTVAKRQRGRYVPYLECFLDQLTHSPLSDETIAQLFIDYVEKRAGAGKRVPQLPQKRHIEVQVEKLRKIRSRRNVG